jgi:putative SOS response-associated peptidase YedK
VRLHHDLPGNGQHCVRRFAILTVPANDLVAIHDRMPAILHGAHYDRWLGIEPDPEMISDRFCFEGWPW